MTAPSVLQDVYGVRGQVGQVCAESDQHAAEDPGDGGDPLNDLISAGLGWLIDHIEPVKQALELVTGSPDALKAAASSYAALGREIDRLGQDIHDEVQRGTTAWQGEASVAARQQVAEFLAGVRGTAQLSAYIGDVLKSSAGMMQAAKDIVVGIIADFVEQMLVTWAVGALGSLLTFGLSDAAAAAATATEASIAITRADEEVNKVRRIVQRIASVIERILAIVRKIAEVIARVGNKVVEIGGRVGEKAEELIGSGGKLSQLAGRGLEDLAGRVEGTGERLHSLGADVRRASGSVESLAGKVAHGGEVGFEDIDRVTSGASRVADDVNHLGDDWTGDGGGGPEPWPADAGPHRPAPASVGDALRSATRDTFGQAGDIAKQQLQDRYDDIKSTVAENTVGAVQQTAHQAAWDTLTQGPDAGLHDVRQAADEFQGKVTDVQNVMTYGTAEPPPAPEQSATQIDGELSATER